MTLNRYPRDRKYMTGRGAFSKKNQTPICNDAEAVVTWSKTGPWVQV